VNIRTGEQFRPEFLRSQSEQQDSGDRWTATGPDGKPIAIFESGAILVYLAGKTGMLMPSDDRGKYAALQWLMFQMGSIGPMMGQGGHFRSNAVPERIEYAINRYTSEVKRLHGVMEKRLSEVPYFGRGAILDRRHCDFSVAAGERAKRHRVGGVSKNQEWFDGIAARARLCSAL